MNAIGLPAPALDGATSVERALAHRRSLREFGHQPLPLKELSQLCWAAQGITGPRSHRTVPSAGALYPLDLLVVAGRVDGLAAGVYRHVPENHALVPLASGDRRADVVRAALEQDWMEEAPALLVIAAVYERTTRKYGERGRRYAVAESGLMAENIALQAVALGLGTCIVGAFDDGDVARALGLKPGQEPLLIMPVGRARGP